MSFNLSIGCCQNDSLHDLLANCVIMFITMETPGLLCCCFCTLEDIERNSLTWNNGGPPNAITPTFINSLMSVSIIDEKAKSE